MPDTSIKNSAVNSENPKPLVLHIAPTPFFADRGCHIRIEGIANCLADLGFDNLVCTYHHGRDVKGTRTSRISPIKSYTKTEAGPSKYKLWADWKLLWLVVKEVRRHKPNVIHAHLHEGLMIGLLAKILLFWMRIPMVADMQGSLVGELETHDSFNKYPWLKWPIKLIERCLMWFAKTIVCSSSHSLEKIKSEFSLSDTKISLVQDGATVPRALSEPDKQALLEKLSLPNDKSLLVYSGALLESKGLAQLQDVITLSKELRGVHFLIIGYPTESLASFLEQQGLADKCTLTGQVAFEELPNLLQLADIAIDPKFSDAGEGSGKMLNYLACKLPVLAFDTSNNRDFLPSDALLSSDAEQMAEQLAMLLSEPNKLEQLGNLNFEHFLTYYSWQQSTNQLKKVYSTLNHVS